MFTYFFPHKEKETARNVDFFKNLSTIGDY